MKSFNKTIKVEVSVDAIAQQVLASMNPEFKHAEQLVEAIIGCALTTDKMLYIYNAVNGFSNGVNFEVGDKVICSEKVYQYVEREGDNQGYDEVYLPMGEATIIEIDEFKDNKLKISYVRSDRKGQVGESTTWVSHTQCEFLAPKLIPVIC